MRFVVEDNDSFLFYEASPKLSIKEFKKDIIYCKNLFYSFKFDENIANKLELDDNKNDINYLLNIKYNNSIYIPNNSQKVIRRNKINQDKIINSYVNESKKYKYFDLSNNNLSDFYLLIDPILSQVNGQYIFDNVLKLPSKYAKLMLLEMELYNLVENDDIIHQLSLFEQPRLIEQFTKEEILRLQNLKIFDLETLENESKRCEKVFKKLKNI